MAFARRRWRTEDIEDYAVTRSKVATASIHAEHFEYVALDSVGPVPDIDTEYPFPAPLSEPPTFVEVRETTAGVLAKVYETAVSATSIILRAEASGPIVHVRCWT